MDVSVLDTFIHKFKHIWLSGQDASLTIDTRAGQAWACLRVPLGLAPGPVHHIPHKAHTQPHRDSPTRRRRRERRANARQANAAATAAHIAPKAAEEVDNPVPSTMEAAVQVNLPHPPTTAEAAEEATTNTDVCRDAAETIEEIVEVTTEQVLRDLDDEVCPDVIYNRSDLTTLLENMSKSREKEREKDNNDRRNERAEDIELFENLLHSKHSS